MLDQGISLAYKIPYLPRRDSELSEDKEGGKAAGIFRLAHESFSVTPKIADISFIVLIHNMDDRQCDLRLWS